LFYCSCPVVAVAARAPGAAAVVADGVAAVVAAEGAALIAAVVAVAVAVAIGELATFIADLDATGLGQHQNVF
jgi:hypothetical protein